MIIIPFFMSKNQNQAPKVGIGVIILKDKKVLLHKRIASHGSEEYEAPGGHLEYMESFIDCAFRETREECGLEIENIRVLYVANLNQYKPKHYVHIELIADWKSGTPRNLEPEKGDSWEWYDLENLPKPLFKTEEIAIETMKSGNVFYDFDLGILSQAIF